MVTAMGLGSQAGSLEIYFQGLRASQVSFVGKLRTSPERRGHHMALASARLGGFPPRLPAGSTGPDGFYSEPVTHCSPLAGSATLDAQRVSG